jgi:hypothetical protein
VKGDGKASPVEVPGARDCSGKPASVPVLRSLGVDFRDTVLSEMGSEDLQRKARKRNGFEKSWRGFSGDGFVGDGKRGLAAESPARAWEGGIDG